MLASVVATFRPFQPPNTTTGEKRANGAAGRGNVSAAAVSRRAVGNIPVISLDHDGCLIEGDSFRAGKRDKLVPGGGVTWRMERRSDEALTQLNHWWSEGGGGGGSKSLTHSGTRR